MLQHEQVLDAPAPSSAPPRVSNDFGRDWPLHRRFHISDGRDDPLGCDGRPSWRGRVHLIGLCAAVPALTMLINRAHGARATLGACIYAAGMWAMFAASTTYHRWVHNLSSRASWRRADHAMIFAAIAGSATPIILIVMPSWRGVALLAVIWSAAAVGAALKFSRWCRGDPIGTAMYAGVSVIAALALPALWIRGGVAPAALYIASGVLYIFGAQWFSRTWPRLKSSVFSYHEVWHAFTVAAATLHFVCVWLIAT